jgi:hypothetical protein
MTQLTKGFFTDHSGVCTGSAQKILSADPSRQFLLIADPSAANAVRIFLNNGNGIPIRLVISVGPVIFDSGVPNNEIWLLGTLNDVFTCWTYP